MRLPSFPTSPPGRGEQAGRRRRRAGRMPACGTPRDGDGIRLRRDVAPLAHYEFGGDPTVAESLPPRPLSHHLALTVYWLSNTIMWGALLHLALQTRLNDWYEESEVGYYFAIIGFGGGLMATLSQIAMGTLSDRSMHPAGRRRPYMVVGTTLTIIALLALGSARTFWPFAAAIVLLQLFSNTALGPFTALLPDTVNPREHGKAAGFMGAARLVGDVGGLILAAQLLGTAGLGKVTAEQIRAFHDERMFLLCAVMGALLLVALLFTCITIHEEPLRRRPEGTNWGAIIGSLKVDVRGNPDFFWLSLSRAITNVGFYIFLEVVPFFVLYTLKVDNPEGTTMLVMMPAIAMAAVGSVPSGILSDRIGRRRLIFASQFIMAVGALGLTFANSVTVAILAVLPAGLAYGIFTAVEWALACNLLPKGESARYLGVWNASAALPQVFGTVIAGLVGSRLSLYGPGLGWRADFAITVICCLLGAYYLRFVHERRRGEDDQQNDEPAAEGEPMADE